MSKKKSSLRKWIILALFLIIAAVIIVIGSRSGQAGAEVAMASAERGDITSLVSATGQIHPEIQVVISSEVPGEIVELPVSDGQAVERGDLLARVNPDTLEAQVKQQEASLASVRASSAS
jgi:HlyD family secretion protein